MYASALLSIQNLWGSLQNGKVQVKGFLRRSGLLLSCGYHRRAWRKPGVRCKAFSSFAGHGSVLYGSPSGVLTLSPRIGGRPLLLSLSAHVFWHVYPASSFADSGQ